MIDVSSKETMHSFYTSTAWIHLRRKALARDHYECVWCKQQGKVTTNKDTVLEVDHIRELKDYPELALELDNLRTLCKECHNKRHHRYQSRENRFDDEQFEWD